jgi:hypothetical protein
MNINELQKRITKKAEDDLKETIDNLLKPIRKYVYKQKHQFNNSDEYNGILAKLRSFEK